MSDFKNYAWPITSVYKDSMDQFYNFLQDKKELLKNKTIAIFGAGIKGNEYLYYLRQKSYSNIVYIDNNPEKQGGFIDTFPILNLPAFLSTHKKGTFAIVVAIENYSGVKAQLESESLKEDIDFFCFKPLIYDNFINEYTGDCSNKYLFFGDCQFTTVSILDCIFEPLSDIVKKDFGFDQTIVLAMHGMGIRAFYHIFQTKLLMNQIPKKILLEVNPLTFTKTRHLLPRSQHIGLLKMIYELCPTNEMADYITLCEQRFGTFQTDFYVNNVKRQKDLNNLDSIKTYLKLNYMYRFDPSVEGFVYLLKFIELCQTKGISLSLFIPPANYQLGGRLFGELFLEKYDAIRNPIISEIKARNVPLVDLSTLLTSEQFASVETNDECANQVGREIVSNVLYKNFA